MSAILRVLGASVIAVALASACGPRASSSATITSAAFPSNAPAAVGPANLPVGLPLTVRITDPISTATTTDGTRFTAVLIEPIVGQNGKEILPTGSIIYGAVVQSRKGDLLRRPLLTITLNEVQFSKGSVRLATDISGAEGGRNDTVRALGTGTVSGIPTLLDDGKTLRIEPGTQMVFHLTEPARIE